MSFEEIITLCFVTIYILSAAGVVLVFITVPWALFEFASRYFTSRTSSTALQARYEAHLEQLDPKRVHKEKIRRFYKTLRVPPTFVAT